LLEFEHLIQINDPKKLHIPAVSREDLWAGLVMRAKHPGQFNPAISSRLEQISDSHFVRYISVADTELRDEVRLQPLQEISTRIEVPETEKIDGKQTRLRAESRTRIEEPEPGCLFVRFMYRRDSANEPGGMDIDEYLKSAYVVNDREAIAAIRQMIASGWPEPS
jgi:hypothetical protein